MDLYLHFRHPRFQPQYSDTQQSSDGSEGMISKIYVPCRPISVVELFDKKFQQKHGTICETESLPLLVHESAPGLLTEVVLVPDENWFQDQPL